MWFATLLIVALFSSQALALKCGGCGLSPCQQPQCCESGQLVPDVCGCCKVCARAEGKTCGGPWKLAGTCSSGLACLRTCQCGTNPSDDSPSKPCVFPFKYKDVSYNKCTNESSETSSFWCATSVNENGEMTEKGDCNPNCPLESINEPIECDEVTLFNSVGVCVSEAKAREAQEPGKHPFNVTVDEGASGETTEVPKCQSEKEKSFCRCVKESKDYDKGKACEPVVGGIANNGFCFLENIEDPSDPTKFCYTDTAWSAAHGRFYSNSACNPPQVDTTTPVDATTPAATESSYEYPNLY